MTPKHMNSTTSKTVINLNCAVYVCIYLLLIFMSNICIKTNNIDGNGLKMSGWNTRGLVAAVPYLKLLMESNDILCVSEHWLYPNRLNILEEISKDFNVVARSSVHSNPDQYGTKRGQGGVAVFWRKSLRGVSPITEITHDRICGVRVHTSAGIVLNVYSVYLPSPGCADDYDEVLDEIAEIINTGDRSTYSILIGDFNADMGYLGGSRSHRKPTKLGMKLSKFLEEFDLTAVNMTKISTGPINTFHSGVGSSTIDYIAVPDSLLSLVGQCSVVSDEILNTSDHFALQATLNIECSIAKSDEVKQMPAIRWNKIKSEVIANVYTSPLEEYALMVMNRDITDKMDSTSIERVTDDVVEKMRSLSNNLPKCRYKPNVRPFWNKKLTQLKKEKVKHFRFWVSEGRPRDEGNSAWVAHKQAKKAFRKEIKFVQKNYESKEIEMMLKSAECDKNKFWNLVKRSRRTIKTNSYSIKNKEDKVVQDLPEVVKVWEKHFAGLSTPKNEERFDSEHYGSVNKKVASWYKEQDGDQFLDTPIEEDEVVAAVRKLNKGKAAGFDFITSEHLQSAGRNMMGLLTGLFNQIIQNEHIPSNFKIGTQIPLYKGKNTCSLDPNNYRGITLLTTLNKVFEIIIWNRLKEWWNESRIISNLQGACKTGMSCVHSALVLQETISVGLGTGKKVFAAYFDVAKAFDSVWIDGLFYQIHEMGVKGRIWRLLYQTYQNFWCKVRVGGCFSDWYRMECGIHQGGFLSLLKYTAFIDPLIRKLEKSGLGCCVVGVPTSPVGYADDMATCSLSKQKLDRSLDIVTEFSNRWRYSYNSSKSAIMVYGESVRESKIGKKYRSFKLCNEKVKETDNYDHVGIKNCIFNNYKARTEERISKGRRAFNAVTSVGIKKKGITMRVCSTLFWSIIAPIVTYGCEVWVLRGDEIELLRKFQRMVGRRCQRFYKRSPNYGAYAPMGWLSLDRYIQGKKLMFLRTITELDDDAICKVILKGRSLEFSQNRELGKLNQYDSPVYDILNTSAEIGLYDEVMNMVQRDHTYTKQQWKDMVWKAVWNMEDSDCDRLYKGGREIPLLFKVIDKSYYLLWWIIADQFPKKLAMCEKMAAIVSDASKLKSNDVALKNSSYWSKVCYKCSHASIESAFHIIMQCSHYEDVRYAMYQELQQLNCNEINDALSDAQNVFTLLLGRQPSQMSLENMFRLCFISGKYITKIYDNVIDR